MKSKRKISPPRRWTDEEWQRAKSLLDSGYTQDAVAGIIGRTSQQIASKKQWESLSSDRRERKALQKRQRRAEYIPSTSVRLHVADYMTIPECVIEERNARAVAAKSLTGWVFGDPPIGYSALDRRGECRS